MTAPVRIAFVGCGRISQNHFDAIAKVEDLALTAVCDEIAERARAAGERFGVPWYTSLDSLLAEAPCDAVVVATPSGLHPVHGIAAARAGKHIICEKPMAVSLEGADDLIRACDEAKVRLFVVKQNRLNPAVQFLKRAVDKGRFGRLYLASTSVLWTRPQAYYDQASWRGTRELDGGALLNQASHYVDLLQWLVGPVESVVAKTGTLARRIECEDTGVASLKFRNGALGSIQVTMLTFPKNLEGSITLLGERGSARVGGTSANRIEQWEFAEPDDDDQHVSAAATTPPTVYGFGHEGYYRNVVAALRGREPALTDGHSGRVSLELILAIYESARTGLSVALPRR